MHPSPVPKSKAIAKSKRCRAIFWRIGNAPIFGSVVNASVCTRWGHAPCTSTSNAIVNGTDPITALNAFDRLDRAIVKYLGADRLDIEERFPMSTSALVTGKLWRAPKARTSSKTGKHSPSRTSASKRPGGRSRPSMRLPTICLSSRPETPSQSAGRSRPRFTPRTARSRA